MYCFFICARHISTRILFSVATIEQTSLHRTKINSGRKTSTEVAVSSKGRTYNINPAAALQKLAFFQNFKLFAQHFAQQYLSFGFSHGHLFSFKNTSLFQLWSKSPLKCHFYYARSFLRHASIVAPDILTSNPDARHR